MQSEVVVEDDAPPKARCLNKAVCKNKADKQVLVLNKCMLVAKGTQNKTHLNIERKPLSVKPFVYLPMSMTVLRLIALGTVASISSSMEPKPVA